MRWKRVQSDHIAVDHSAHWFLDTRANCGKLLDLSRCDLASVMSELSVIVTMEPGRKIGSPALSF